MVIDVVVLVVEALLLLLLLQLILVHPRFTRQGLLVGWALWYTDLGHL